MASAVLTRIRVGDKIVDAKGVSRLYQSRISGWSLVMLALAALVTLVVAMLSLPLRPRLPGIPERGPQPREAVANWTLLVIDFRYHLVSIIAVFLALAIGLAIGANLLPQATDGGPAAGSRPGSPTPTTA